MSKFIRKAMKVNAYQWTGNKEELLQVMKEWDLCIEFENDSRLYLHGKSGLKIYGDLGDYITQDLYSRYYCFMGETLFKQLHNIEEC